LLVLGIALSFVRQGDPPVGRGSRQAVPTTLGERIEGMEAAVRFGPERTALAVVLVLALGALPLGLSSPYLAPLLLVPLVAAVWVLRARVVAGGDGLEVCNGLGVRRLGWSQVDAFDIPKRGPVVLRDTGGGRQRLTALPRHELRRLLEIGSR
jgi:hypothetical protein